MRYFLEISYKGTNYKGWQVQNNAITVQGTIQLWLSRVLNFNIKIVGSSRTDSGVHAIQQYAHFDFTTEIDLQKLVYRINAVLPDDISIKTVFKVEDTTHARYSAIARTYKYMIISYKDPFLSDRSYFLLNKLDIDLMNEAATLLCAEDRNCKIFSKTNFDVTNYLCSIISARWICTNNGTTFEITSNRFLRGMVRIIVAYCIEVGLRKITINEFEEIMKKQLHENRPSLVPACGLTLTEVRYQ